MEMLRENKKEKKEKLEDINRNSNKATTEKIRVFAVYTWSPSTSCQPN